MTPVSDPMMYGPTGHALPGAGFSIFIALLVAVIGDLYGIELAATLLAVFAAWKLPSFGNPIFERVERIGSRLAEHRTAAPLAVAAANFLIRLAILPIHPRPHPIIADEFSHLLIADTFAHLRLTNPSHSLWPSFETLHIIPLPTYNSMYFPGPALLLLLGRLTLGSPWLGILAGTSALCGLICWALQAWLPPRWALLGGVIAVLKIGLVSYWVDSYWGGTFAALGSTLVLGAMPRLQRRPQLGLSLLVALGIGMLLNSRPFESLGFCLVVGVQLMLWLFQPNGIAPGAKLLRSIAPMAICLAAIALLMGLYFTAVTGSPFKLPYQVNQQRYGWPMTLPWTKIHYVRHTRVEFAQYFRYELNERRFFTSIPLFVAGILLRLQLDWRFFVGPALTIPLLFIRRIIRSRRLRFVFVAGGAVLLVTYCEPHFPHYMAPATLPLIAAIVQGYRYLRHYRSGGVEVGLRLSRAIPVILAAFLTLRLVAEPLDLMPAWSSATSWCCVAKGNVNQDAVVARLPATGKHLILVRYSAKHPWVEEWVFNAADIDSSRVVWARELGGEQDQELLRYFKDRQVWILEPDLKVPRLTPERPPVAPADGP
jgi:hypothetical protein